MKRSRAKQFNIGTSQHDLLAKPYGFCCDIKDHDPNLLASKEKPAPLFPLSSPTNEGPDIKFRIRENDDDPSFTQRSTQRSQRSGLRSGQRFGQRSGVRSGQRGGQRSGQRGGPRSKYRGAQQISWNNKSRGQRQWFSYRGAGSKTGSENLSERMICKRCSGPLRWYLEDEIVAAREIMMKKRQDKYNMEIENNIKIAKKKEKRRRERRKKMSGKSEEDTIKENISKEDTNEGE